MVFDRTIRERTIVLVQTPFSVSHVRTVESNPALTAVLLSDFTNIALDTRAVWLLRTFRGAFLFGLVSWSSPTLRLFFLSVPSSKATSSVVGIEVSQNPIRPSLEAVSKYEPDELEVIEVSGAVCKWREASVRAEAVGPVERVI